jgi:hypothetical protein
MMRFFTLFGFLGMAGGFLVISPALRNSLVDTVGQGQQLIQANEPYSYFGIGAVVILGFCRYMYRCSQPR